MNQNNQNNHSRTINPKSSEEKTQQTNQKASQPANQKFQQSTQPKSKKETENQAGAKLNTEELTVQIKKLQSELAEEKEKSLKLKDANLELLVEMEQLRKRTEREIEKVNSFGLEGIIKDLLPFVDSLEMGLTQKNASAQTIQQGIKMSLDMLNKVLMTKKVNFIVPEVNSPLNPELHEAITVINNDNIKHNHIVDVMQKGVILSGRVIRSAKVIVSGNPKSNSDSDKS